MNIQFEGSADYRTDKCDHQQHEGCWWCCQACNYVMHRCDGCGTATEHGNETCANCRKLYFTDD